MGGAQLSTESIIKLVPPLFFNKERQITLLCLAAMAKEIVWLTPLKRIRTGNFLSRIHHLKRKLHSPLTIKAKDGEKLAVVASVCNQMGASSALVRCECGRFECQPLSFFYEINMELAYGVSTLYPTFCFPISLYSLHSLNF